MEIILNIIKEFQIILAVISLITGLLQCFFGYKFLRFWVTLIGFLIGFSAGLGIASANIDVKYVPLIIGVAAGILLGFLSFKIYLVGVFLFIGTIAAVATGSFLKYASLPAVAAIIICIAVFILCGILAVKFQRPMVIVITALSGASASAKALRTLVAAVSANHTYFIIILLGLAACGILLQFLTTRGPKQRRHRR